MTARSSFEGFIGVDQTGAVRADGTPRPLRAAMLVRAKGAGSAPRARLVLADLPSASRGVFATWAAVEGVRFSRLAIVLDAVIGVPAACWPREAAGLTSGDRPWALFARAAAQPGWGRAVGEAFFAELLPKGTTLELPRRACEALAGANSVFVTRPFQKNVQTGTFRIWKDLAADGGPRWANFGAFDARAAVRGAPWIYEGYPSLVWARVFGQRTRAPARFPEVLARAAAMSVVVDASAAVVRQVTASPDVADAAVLALGAACLDATRRGRLAAPASAMDAGEGWILGLEDARPGP